MVLEEIYKFKITDFNDNGFHKVNKDFFLDIINEWEKDFHEKHKPFFANFLFSTEETMILINSCLNLSPKEKAGMDLFDGEIDFEKNFKIEEFSEYTTIYAIDSELKENEDNPLFFVIDEKLPSGKVILKYISNDDDDDDDLLLPDPENIDKKKIKI